MDCAAVDHAQQRANDERVAATRQLIELGLPLIRLRADQPKKPMDKGWTEAPPLEPDEALAHARRANVGVRTGRHDSNHQSVVVVDFDMPVDDAMPCAEQLGLSETWSARTGGGGMHMYFRAPEQPLPNTAGRLRPKVDIRGEGGQAVAVGSIHETGQRYEWLPGRSPDDVELASFPDSVRAQLDSATKPSKACELHDRPIPTGQRNTEAARYAGYLFSKGLDDDDVLNGLRGWNHTRCVSPLPDEELLLVFRSIRERAQRGKAIAPPAHRLEPLHDFFLEPDQPALIEGLLGQCGLGLIYGKYGSAKTYVVLDLLSAIANGDAAWCGLSLEGIPEDKRGVVYVAAENWSGPRHRIAARAGGAPSDQLMQRFVFDRRADGNFANTTVFDETFGRKLDQYCADVQGYSFEQFQLAAAEQPQLRRQHGLCVICIDTVARATPGMQENDASDINEFIRVCDHIRETYGLAVILVHHSGKNPAQGARGSSALTSAVDVALEAIRKKNVVSLRVDKAPKEELPRSLDLAFRLDEVAYPCPISKQPVTRSRLSPLVDRRQPCNREKLLAFVDDFTESDDDRGPLVKSAADKLSVSRQAIRKIANSSQGQIELYQHVDTSGKKERSRRLRLTELGRKTIHQLGDDPQIDWSDV